MNDMIKKFIIVMLSILSIIAFEIGILNSCFKEDCTYQTIASYYPTYILGCELFRKRFNTEE